MQINKTLTLGTLLSLVVLISSWLSFQQAMQQTSKFFLPKQTGPDSFMEKVIATRMNVSGQLENELFSPRMEHYATQNITNISSPHLLLYSAGAKPWRITALHGRAYKGAAWIDLWTNVKGHQAAGREHPEVTLLTSAITVYPKSKYAITDQSVKILRGGLTMDGIGMEADLNKNEIELLSNIKSYHAPT